MPCRPPSGLGMAHEGLVPGERPAAVPAAEAGAAGRRHQSDPSEAHPAHPRWAAAQQARGQQQRQRHSAPGDAAGARPRSRNEDAQPPIGFEEREQRHGGGSQPGSRPESRVEQRGGEAGWEADAFATQHLPHIGTQQLPRQRWSEGGEAQLLQQHGEWGEPAGGTPPAAAAQTAGDIWSNPGARLAAVVSFSNTGARLLGL